MTFKYKLAEDIKAGTQGMFRDLLDKWNAEDKEKEAEIAKLPQDLQDKIKGIAKEALSKKKCYECKTIKK
jgi:cell division protein FtsB